MPFLSVQDIVVVVTILVISVISLVVYMRNIRSATNLIFSFLGLIILVWLIFTSISFHPFPAATSLFWIRLSTFFAPLICLFFLIFSATVPNHTLGMKKPTISILSIITLIVMGIIISPYTFTKVEVVNNLPNPSPGVGMLPFMIFVASTIGSSIFILVRKWRNSRGLEKHQMRLIMLGIISMPGLILLTNVLPILLFRSNILVPFTPLLTLVFFFITAYAIVKHRFLDIRIIVARSISYSLLVIIFGIFYSFLFAVISSLFTLQNIQTKTVIISTILALIMAFSFQDIKKFIEKYTDKVFYKDHYDVNKLLYDLTLVMASTLQYEDLSHQFLLTLIKQMKVSNGAIILESNEKIIEVSHEGYVETPSYNEYKVLSLIKESRFIVFDELDESKTKSIMREMNISLAVNIATAGQQIGLLTLGEKLSGDIYTSEDIKVLEILVPELAVAVKNSLSYDEISRFNITLKNEIDEATLNLRQANDKLQELDRLKDEFVSVASHELRTPMTAIKSYLWMALNKSSSKLDPQLKNEITIAYDSTERLLKLVTDMLTISRIEGKRLKLQKEEFNMNEVAQQVYDILKISAYEKKIVFDLDLPDKPIIINGDKEKIREILQNLIGNALKFTPPKGYINLRFFDDSSKLRFEITNSGSFISPDELPKLFQKFNRLNIESTNKEGASMGTGLGLFITKQIVEMHSGIIEVYSDEKKGTTFHIEIPKNV
jgi:signal transduction histidine kinase